MVPWLDELRSDLDREFPRSPRVATLATVDEHGRPRARSVVVRGITDAGDLWIVSDARSEKNAHLRARADAEVVFWFPALRRQFRLSGSVEIADAISRSRRREEAWRDLSDAARALFAWPAPGTPRTADPTDVPQALAADVAVPDAFELLILSPDAVDALDLTSHPHRRRIWAVDGGPWRVRDVNP